MARRETQFMSISSISAHKRLRSLARLAPLVAWAGVLTIALPAAAQEPTDGADPAPPSEPSPDAPPPPPEEASPDAPPPTTEASVDASLPPIEPNPEAEVAEGEAGEVVIVTGYGRSLGAAINRKKKETGQVDAIVAEDIADFPDLNLAESLQRIPGVAISRTYGEGGQITVRGLSGLYTRVRVNGMEARAFGGSNGNIANRGFDFNLFASELFNSIVVHKTASANLDEGSLGSVVTPMTRVAWQ
jgi:iron complex outermembrane recepter protein